jgi:hypothetical protein
VPAGDTPFCFFFRPVFPYLRDLYWFATRFESSPFVRLIYEDGGEERLDAARLDAGLESTGDVLHRPGTLPDLAPYVDNDWLDLIGLRASEEQAIATSHLLATARDDYKNAVADKAEIAFLCMDGFWWEFYPRDPSLLDLVARPLEGISGVSLRTSDLRNRWALFGDSAAS